MDLSQEVTAVKGVGPKTAAQLAKAGIHTVGDLLYHLPRDYENFRITSQISDLRPGKVVIRGQITNLKTTYTRRRGFNITEGEIHDDTGSVRAVWFNQAYRAKQFDPDREYYFTGTYDLHRGRYQLSSPNATLVSDVVETDGLQPIYPARGALKSLQFHKLISALRPEFANIPDLLPNTSESPDFVKDGARGEALFGVHFPANPTEVAQGRAYLAYEEIFELVLAAHLNRQESRQLRAIPLKFNADDTKKLTASLPFTLTPAQKRAAWEIMQDLEHPTPMNRLLQGDVGSGKTMVAALATHQTAQNGHQTALLAPTAILATQHAEGLERVLGPLGVRIALLTGATKFKPALKRSIARGEIDLIVGTHALLTDDTHFHSLALCIIDEQHRFGVGQRQKLLTKTSDTGFAPHQLSMTATPIPRSLQLTVFGDLDVSVINQLPKGRQPIKTKLINEVNLANDLYPHVRQTLAAGQQVYWICPAIEDSPTKETTSVKKQAERCSQLFPKARVEFLHGRLDPAEKDRIMSDFAAHCIDILVSTTVVEVGVDVPNATDIIIMDAENYGLAQLHQLRGRVGRGDKASYCYLVVKGADQPSQRLRELEQSTDGFHLAEVDLKLRGPGEIYGNLQHGALDLRIATLADTHTISLASRQARAFAKHPEDMVQYPELAAKIQKYQQLTTLN